MNVVNRVVNSVQTRANRFNINLQILRMAARVSSRAHPDSNTKPVVFFNASTRLVGVSLNAAFSLITAWALRLQHVPIAHFVCQAGMSRCVQGTDRDDYSKSPPCQQCISQSRWLYSNSLAIPFTYRVDSRLNTLMQNFSLSQLQEIEYPPPAVIQKTSTSDPPSHLPLGQLVLPSIRWLLRRHHLEDDEPTRFLFRQYILSAYHIAREFSSFLDQTDPQAVVLFNGQFFPEATARWVSLKRGIPTITHEAGLLPFSAFFTTGEATAYPLQVPDDFTLNNAQNARLDAYLSQRFQGQFSMAGIRFWPEIKSLDQAFLNKAASFKQIVSVFTNVIFDTSQPHSNVVFPHMFAWLDMVLGLIRNHPETLFVIRAHPDEGRPGKASQESVAQWIRQNQATSFPNLVFVDSHQALSSYELIQRSKFVMVYNSTIGLEASLLGSPVLCAGRARFTQLSTVFFPRTMQAYQQQAESFLTAPEISVPPEHKHNARRFLYYQLYRSSLPFNKFITNDRRPGFVRLRRFSLDQLTPQQSPAVKVLVDGILKSRSFLLADDPPED
jgi:hypothetical protein